jgi:hypothetical protein
VARIPPNMVEQVSLRLDVCRKLMQSLADPSAWEKVCKQQSKHLVSLINKMNQISDEEAGSLTVKVAELSMPPSEKDKLMIAIGTKIADPRQRSSCFARRRQQDYVTFLNFLTADIWSQLEEHPQMAQEIVLGHLNRLGLICPTEPTYAYITAVVAAIGNWHPCMVNMLYTKVKKRLKQMYTTEPAEYITQLPATPAQLLAEHPGIAHSVFSADCLPVASRLHDNVVNYMLGEINMRNSNAQPSVPSLMCNSRMMSHPNPFVMSNLGWEQPALGNSTGMKLFNSLLVRPNSGPEMRSNTPRLLALPDREPKQLALPDGRLTSTDGAPLIEPHAADTVPIHPAAVAVALAGRPHAPTGNGHEGTSQDATQLPTHAAQVDGKLARSLAAVMEEKVSKAMHSAVEERSHVRISKKAAMKRPAAAMKRPAAKPSVGAVKVKKPQWMLKQRPNGCARCRDVRGCTPSCWKQRGH